MNNTYKIYIYILLWIVCFALALVGVRLFFGYEHKLTSMLAGFPLLAAGFYFLFKAGKLMRLEKARYAVPRGLSVNESIEQKKKIERLKKDKRSWYEFWLWS